MSEIFTMPKLSFIVTSYNYENYILECLKSVMAQSYQNIEIIVVDDNSSDNSVEIIENFIKNQNADIKFIKNEKNLGQLGSIFKGIEESTGDFIACIDSDDKIAPEYASTHILTHLNIQTALSVCDMSEIGENSALLSINSSHNPQIPDKNCSIEQIQKEFLNIKNNYEVQKLDLKKQFFGGWWWAPTSCGVFRKSSIEPFLNFRNEKNWKTSPDKILFNFLHLIGGSVKIKSPLVYYRRHGKNAGECAPITGDKRFNGEHTRAKYLSNQINLYKDVTSFLFFDFQKDKRLYSLSTTVKLIITVIFSIPKLIIYKLFFK